MNISAKRMSDIDMALIMDNMCRVKYAQDAPRLYDYIIASHGHMADHLRVLARTDDIALSQNNAEMDVPYSDLCAASDNGVVLIARYERGTAPEGDVLSIADFADHACGLHALNIKSDFRRDSIDISTDEKPFNFRYSAYATTYPWRIDWDTSLDDDDTPEPWRMRCFEPPATV